MGRSARREPDGEPTRATSSRPLLWRNGARTQSRQHLSFRNAAHSPPPASARPPRVSLDLPLRAATPSVGAGTRPARDGLLCLQMPDLSGTPLSGRKKAYSVVDVGEEADELEGGSSRNQTRKGKKRRQDTSVDANEEEPQLSLKQLAGGGVVALLCLVVISKISYSMIKAKNAVISQEADTSLQESARLQHKLNHYDHQSQHSSFLSTQHSLSLPSTQLSSPPPPPPRPSLQQAMEQQKAQGGESWQQPPQRSQQSQQQLQQPQQELRPGAAPSPASTGPSLTSPSASSEALSIATTTT